MVAFALGLFILSDPTRLSPGPVLLQHAAFEDSCDKCHEGLGSSTLLRANYIVNAGLFGEERPLANAGKCLFCHAFGEQALLPHGTGAPDGTLQTRTLDGDRQAWSKSRRPTFETRVAAAILPDRLRMPRPGVSGTLDGGVACVVCHRDHKGRDFVATLLTDTQCQACHAEAFEGFSQHPPFVGYPHRLSARLSFDHETHFSRHFARSAEEGIAAPDSCGTCHGVETWGNMVIRGFGTCASCHEREITHPPDGRAYLEFLAPPGLDLEALADAGIGEWPIDAESEANAFLRLMLEAGGYLGSNHLAIIAELDLLDLAEATDAEKMTAVRLAWAFKQLSRDLVRNGPQVFVAAARSLRSPNAPDWSELAAGLPLEVLDSAVRQWFPNLEQELERHGREPVPTRAIDHDLENLENPADLDEWLRYGGWRAAELALVYRPTGHADRFMRGWLTISIDSTSSPAALFEALTGQQPSMACARCHVGKADVADRPGERNVHWFARGTEPEKLGHLKAFSHLSHRQAVAERGCVTCHKLVTAGSAKQSPSGFAPVSPDACPECHRPQTGLATCLTCHEYHFEHPEDLHMRAASNVTAKDPFGD